MRLRRSKAEHVEQGGGPRIGGGRHQSEIAGVHVEGWVFSPINCSALPLMLMAGGTTPPEMPASLSASRPDSRW